jgi:hypothetical protein
MHKFIASGGVQRFDIHFMFSVLLLSTPTWLLAFAICQDLRGRTGDAVVAEVICVYSTPCYWLTCGINATGIILTGIQRIVASITCGNKQLVNNYSCSCTHNTKQCLACNNHLEAQALNGNAYEDRLKYIHTNRPLPMCIT